MALSIQNIGPGACSVRHMRGFNDADMLTSENLHKTIGKMLYTMATQINGWRGGGLELVTGVECNSKNPNAQTHHKYATHCGHKFRAAVAKLGGIGRVHLPPWSSGDSDTGSQIRMVTWDLVPIAKWQARLDEVRAQESISQEWQWVLDGFKNSGRW